VIILCLYLVLDDLQRLFSWQVGQQRADVRIGGRQEFAEPGVQ